MTRTRAEWLDLLRRCQDGEASCLFVLKEMEAEMARVVVKPLVWTPRERNGRPMWDADLTGRTLFTVTKGGLKDTLFVLIPVLFITSRTDGITMHDTLDAAQAVAQEQWDGFVHAAIQP